MTREQNDPNVADLAIREVRRLEELSQTVSDLVGAAIREIRRAEELRQDDVAARARVLGLKWTRRTVHELEQGRRDVTVEELLMMPFITRMQLPDIMAMAGDEEGRIRLAGSLTLNGSDLIRLLAGTFPKSALSFTRERVARVAEIRREVDQSFDDAEWKAAKKLGVPLTALQESAERIWGRRLPHERERRLEEKLGPLTGPARRLQALRGHMTRTLLHELREDLITHGVTPKMGRSEGLIGDAYAPPQESEHDDEGKGPE